jgi:hypothetical protein
VKAEEARLPVPSSDEDEEKECVLIVFRHMKYIKNKMRSFILYSSSSTVNMIQSRAMRWPRHVVL